MTPFPVTPTHRYSDYWNPVCAGLQPPDEYQARLMEIVQAALDSGLFYTVDVMKYAREHADFIPAEAWNWQYKQQPVEGGLMGMELYMARDTIRKGKERGENAEAERQFPAGTLLGALSINGKRYTGMTVTKYEYGEAHLSGKAGKYSVTCRVEPRNLPRMIENAIQRGWRKA